MKQLGLIGFPLSHSFSKGYFSEKFRKEKIKGYHYENFELNSINLFPFLLERFKNLQGLNVTIPYKESVIPFLDKLDDSASIGAVNTILIRKGKTTGFNTDVYGFEKSLEPHLLKSDTHGLILGTGGASKAVKFVLDKLGIQSKFVSRAPAEGELKYGDLNKEVFRKYQLVINTTPLGMYPKSKTIPDIDFDLVGPEHLFFDLVYNPQKTLFLERAGQRGARTQNGLEMLHLQAEKAWQIWTH